MREEPQTQGNVYIQWNLLFVTILNSSLDFKGWLEM